MLKSKPKSIPDAGHYSDFNLSTFREGRSLKCRVLCLSVVALHGNPAREHQTLEQEITSTLSSEWLIMFHESTEMLVFSVPDTLQQDVLLKCYSVFFLWFIILHIPTRTEKHSKYSGSLLFNKKQILFQLTVLPEHSPY